MKGPIFLLLSLASALELLPRVLIVEKHKT